MNGFVSDIQRFSVNDGYGIRTIIFLAGCNMNCAWCQNPETISYEPKLMFNSQLCSGCDMCLKACLTDATQLINDAIMVDFSKCTSCFRCIENCFFEARNTSCKEMNVEKVFDIVLKDKVFFSNSGGGLTISGGEPFCQSAFCAELAKLSKSAGIHTAVETSGNVPYASLMPSLPYIDLFLYDIKAISDDLHRKWTLSSNKTILHNFERLCRTNCEIIVRVPLVPGINDGLEFRLIADYVSKFDNISEIHILPYHTIGNEKYDQIGMKYTLDWLDEENVQEIESCKKYALTKGLRVSVGGSGF